MATERPDRCVSQCLQLKVGGVGDAAHIVAAHNNRGDAGPSQLLRRLGVALLVLRTVGKALDQVVRRLHTGSGHRSLPERGVPALKGRYAYFCGTEQPRMWRANVRSAVAACSTRYLELARQVVLTFIPSFCARAPPLTRRTYHFPMLVVVVQIHGGGGRIVSD